MREIELTSKQTATVERYRRMVKEWEDSGETAATVAARNGIATATLKWWRSELKRMTKGEGRTCARPIAATELLPVRLISPCPAAAVFEVALNGGRRVVRIPAGFDATDVRALIEAVEGRPC